MSKLQDLWYGRWIPLMAAPPCNRDGVLRVGGVRRAIIYKFESLRNYVWFIQTHWSK